MGRGSKKFYDDIDVKNLFNQWHRHIKIFTQNLNEDCALEVIKNCTFIVIDKIPQFDNFNSNQQQRFVTLLDIIYDNSIPIAVTADQSLDKFTSSKLLEKPFERTISRLYELTSKAMNS